MLLLEQVLQLQMLLLEQVLQVLQLLEDNQV